MENFSTVLEKISRQSRTGIICPNRVIEETAGQVNLRVGFLGYKHLVPIRFATTLNCEVLLGHDFEEIFDFEIKFKHRIWRVREGL